MTSNPFDRFMLLHADTIFSSSCIELFKKCESMVAVQTTDPYKITDYRLGNKLKEFFKNDLTNTPILDTGVLVFESKTAKIISQRLLEVYKIMNNEEYYITPKIESIFLSMIVNEMKIKVLFAGDIYNSRTSKTDMKVYHHKGE